MYMTSKTYSKISQTFSILRRTTARAALLTLVMVGGTAVAWAQAGEDRSGFYYIANYNNNGYSTTNLANNYYLCPSTVYYDGDDGYQDSGDMPYLTTDKTGQVSDSKWQVTFAKTISGLDYYYIKHVDSNKYLTFNTSKSTTENRLRMHLQSDLATNGDALFCFYLDTGRGNSLSIRPKSDTSNRSINPANGNKEGKGATSSSSVNIGGVSRYVGGMIGLYKAEDANSTWYLEEKFTRPTINYNNETNKVEITSIDGTTIHYTTDGTDPTANSPTYRAAFTIPAGTKSVKAVAVRTSDGEVSNIVTLALTATFHVVNKANAVALSYTGTVKDFTATPAEIQSPYIPDAANYKLFSSQAAANAYSAAATAEARATAAAAATTITTDNQTVYVGYYYDPSDRPSDLPVLDGSKWYQMEHNHGNVANYFYSNLNKNLKPEDSNIASTTSDASITESKYLWHFTGNDPYDIGMANKDMNDRKATSDPGEWLVKQNTTISQGWFRTMTGYHKDDGASMVMLRYDADYYCLAIISDAEQVGTRDYLYYFGANGQNNANDYFMRNNKAESPLYVSDRAGCQLSFSSVAADFTFHIVDTNGRVAISHTVTDQPVGTALTDYTDIPEPIRSPYLAGETLTFYTFSGDYSQDHLTAENQITETPLNSADIYVTYTTDHLTDKFLHLRGARVFNMTVNGEYLYDNGSTGSGTLSHESTDVNKADASRLWTFKGGDPYAVQIENAATKNFLAFNTATNALSLADAPANKYFILMDGSTAGDGTAYAQMELMAATGTSDFYRIGQSGDALGVSNTATAHDATLQVCTYLNNRSVNYYLIDKADKLIEGPIVASSSELALPTEWVSPLVSAYHYYKAATESSGTYSVDDADEITSLVDVGVAGNVYVTYDVGNTIDLTGTNNYLLKFSGGEKFYQENGKDAVMGTKQKAVYPYNNGDFNLYVYGQEQWESQLASGASTRTRWLWKFESENNDPYHVRIKSYQNHTVKDKDLDDTTKDKNYGPGCSYLQTYKPSDYSSVITNIAYENEAYSTAYPDKMSVSMVNGQPTEYMFLGTSILNMTMKTFNEVDGERRVVDSFEQYWKNNPTVENLAGANPAANNATLEAKGWHQFTSWAFSAPWGGGSKVLAEGKHWYQTISMGSDFTVEEVSLAPQVILLDQHGWEIVRVPLSDAAALRKYDSPMVQQYHWYPTANKAGGYHKYSVSSQEIPVYDNNRKVVEGASFTHNSTTLAYTPYDYFETIKEDNGWDTQDDRVKSDFYVTYTVLPTFANSYRGAATENATSASAFLLVQDGHYATTDGTTISTTTDTPDMENLDAKMLWQLLPNFNIDREMGYKYAGETGAQDGALSKAETDQENYDNGMNVFDPYNLQIRSQAYPLRYLTANTSGSALTNGVWTGSTSTLSLQNLGTKQTAAGHDNTSLNITNATFMIVSDGDGSMRLMPRFDHDKVMQEFATFEAPLASDHTDAAKQNLGFTTTTKEIHSTYDILDMGGTYKLAPDFTIYGSVGTSAKPFHGIIDGQLNTISGTSHALIGYADGAKIKNVILDNVSISGGSADGNVGAICNEATGATRIYNCGVLATNSTVTTDNDGYTHIASNSSSVSGSNYVGGLVGLLDGEARVINCFSYANITGGDKVGGIVGYNNVATTSANLKTMVMNCMFYGDITGGSNKAPIYNGTNIVNKGTTGVGNYNYFYGDASYVQDRHIDTYNCALMAETRFLQRFEFFRHLLNCHRELAAWWATGNYTAKDEMAKWVLLPSQIGTSTPYPVLAKPGYYPSVVNIDTENATTQTERNKGGLLGTLEVTIRMGDGAQFKRPTGAEIVNPSLTLNITDKDPEHFNFNYGKVQLPYYNDVGTKNYTGNRVVTGWKIVSITGGTSGTFSTGTDATTDANGNITSAPYNFADRNCTNKDLYGDDGSNRIFNQGAYWDVPEGVTAITIEPYWAKAAYLADANADMVYESGTGDNAMKTAVSVPNVGGGTIYTNGSSYNIAGENQVVYTSVGNARDALGKHSEHTVYDYAIVLVGNAHNIGISSSDAAYFYTLMSADFDKDNEPDYSYILRFNGRAQTHPVRVDFLNIPGLGMAQKSTGETGTYNFGIMQPIGWFETTNTSLFRVTQFEYDCTNRGAAPLILQGGVMEQWVSDQNNDVANKTTYFHVGGNVWFKEFHRGTHIDKDWTSTHPPLSVTGGDYDEFYLTGLYKAVTKTNDDAECYINGGRFGILAGTGIEGIGDDNNNADTKGNIIWQIQHADIEEFYGGGINAASRIGGSITTVITDSHVGLFCGGPKFGDLYSGKTVMTTATDCEFDTYFGAGYGGNSYSIYPPSNKSNTNGDYGESNWNTFVNDSYKQEYQNKAQYKGVSTEFYHQYLPMSNNYQNVERIFVKFVIFSLATTRNVTSTLTGCTINKNFYGGGSLGKVDGPVTSTLNNCTVKGSVFGAGYSASLPTVEVMNTGGFVKAPFYDANLGVYMEPTYPETVTYTWEHAATVNSTATAIDKTKHILYTIENLDNTNLGSVSGDVTLTITGADTYIGGNVYGGGDESSVGGNTTVNINAGKTLGNVYGGGNIGSVGTFTKADATYHTEHPEVPVGKPITRTDGGKTTVTISGSAEIGRDGMSMLAAGGPDDYGHVFGAGRGTTDPLYNDPDYKDKPITDAGKQARIAALTQAAQLQGKLDTLEMLAYVNETEVTISESAFVKGSVYGGSENGHVLGDTWVKISGGQIGCGKNTTERFPEAKFARDYELEDDEDMECASWDYTYPYRPHDIFANVEGYDSRGGYTTATDGHTFFGNVFGGGSGYYPYAPGKWLRTAGRVEGNTKVEVTGGHILTSIYGGNEMTDVGNGLSMEEGKGKCEIIMSGGTLGVPRSVSQIQAHPVTCYVFGAGKGDQRTFFNDWTNVNNTEVTIKGTARIYGSVFGGGEDGHVLGDAKVTIDKVETTTGEGDDAVTTTDAPYIGTWGTSYVDGNIFGGGRGFGGDALTAGGVCGNVQIDIKDGTMLGSIYGGGRLGSVGTYLVPQTLTDGTTPNPKYGQEIPDGKQQIVEGPDNYEPADAPGVNHGHITINISGGTIGNDHEYTYYAPGATIDKVADNIPLTEFDYRNHVLYTKGGNVFAGCMGRLDGLDGSLLPHWKDMAKAKTTTLTITGGQIKSNVYGGGELGTLSGGATISITGGSVGTKVGTDETAYYYGSVYGGGKGSTDPRDAANIHIAGQVGGDVTVSLNEGLAGKDKGGIVHQIFGCNDMNGSPKGSVDVHVYATQNADATQIANTDAVEASGETPAVEAVENAKRLTHYDVEAVYGGGNLAAYMPTADNAKAKVTIDGCKFTSIRQVYGGGNAASVPATLVDINGTFEIDEVFGGGNGKDKLPDGSVNPGANVGYKDYSANETSTDASKGAATKELRVANYSYGTGEANMNIHGGTVHRVYGGSNTKGNVRISAVTMLEEAGCDFSVDEAYGGGKSAPMDAEAKLMMACIPGLKAAYGGAMDAEIEGDVELTITNGSYDRVFGGNNVDGFIHGTIQVNIEETGCKPVIIGQLYGGGNQAPYTAPEDQPGPTVNVRSFTSIGEVYGGGYGQPAKVTGDTHVNINVCEGRWKEGFTYADGTTTDSKTGDKTLSFNEYKRTYNAETGKWDFDLDKDRERITETKNVSVYLPPHNSGSIGGINKVFGGGNAAEVDGSTFVYIGTEIGDTVVFKTPLTKSVQTSGQDTPDDDSDDVYEDQETTPAERTHVVKGVDIRGNVFGGGNDAKVTGDTNVKIGKKK